MLPQQQLFHSTLLPFLLQAHHEARGPIGFPEGCDMSSFSHRSSVWHRTGYLLSWCRGDCARFIGIAALGFAGGGCVVSAHVTLICTERMVRLGEE